MGTPSPRADLPDCFFWYLRAVLEARQERIEHFVSSVVTDEWTRPRVVAVLSGRRRPDRTLIKRMQAQFHGQIWRFIIGKIPMMDVRLVHYRRDSSRVAA